MPRKRYNPSPEVRTAIVSRIRAGTYRHVAAEAEGIPAAIFKRWLEQAAKPRARKKYRELAEEVMRAEAEVRAEAEATLYKDDPKTWLKSGPGRETAEQPGWSGVVRPSAKETARTNALSDPAWQELWAVILSALASFPEARESVSRALAGVKAEAPRPVAVCLPSHAEGPTHLA